MARKEETLDFDTIAQIYKTEKSTQKLSSINPKFYHLYEDYLSSLKAELDDLPDDDDESPTATMLKDEIKKSKQRMKKIRELRERKIALLSVLKANGASVKDASMTPEEDALFKDLVRAVRSHKDVVRLKDKGKLKESDKKPETSKEEEKEREEASIPVKEKVDEPPAPQEKSQQTIETATRKASMFKVVQILEDIPEFMGTNHSYKLDKENIVSLPKEIAELLCNRGKALELNVAE